MTAKQGPPSSMASQHTLGKPFAARFIGMLLAMASAVVFMIGARPALVRDAGHNGPGIANTVGAGLGALSVSSFVAGSMLDRRARQADEMQIETRANNRTDVRA